MRNHPVSRQQAVSVPRCGAADASMVTHPRKTGGAPRRHDVGRLKYLAALLLLAAAIAPAPALAQANCNDAVTWTGIIPDCLSAGDTYRILFVTSGSRSAASSNIADYNTFVQAQADAATGNPFSGITFNVLGSTAAVAARDNTDTHPTDDGPGELIFYYRGRRVANDYADLYDNDGWDTNESRNQNGATFGGETNDVWTGTARDGTSAASPLGPPRAGRGNPRAANAPLATSGDAPASIRRSFYALSTVLTVPPADTVTPSFDSGTSIDNQVYRINSPITSRTLPEATVGDGALVYSISPTLPTGLTLTGRILTGTPAASTVQAPTTYTYRVDDTDVSSTDFSTLTFTIRIIAGAGVNICGRTPEVRTAILAASDDTDCTSVADFATITSLDLSNMSITALQSGDFAGLTELMELNVSSNGLTTLPADIFAGLTALTDLNLSNLSLTVLPADIFAGLTALTDLNLSNNLGLTTLPADIFAGLTALTDLNLSNLSLTVLPDGIFDGLTALQRLSLSLNSFTARTGLPAGIFDDVLDTLGTIGFAIDNVVRQAHFVCSRPDFATIVATTTGVTDCIRITAAQFDAYNLADATLSGLTLSPGTLAEPFATGTTTYTVVVARSVTSVTVTPTATNAAGAAITVDTAIVTSGSASAAILLAAVDTALDIPIVVTAADGTTTLTYTVTVTRAAFLTSRCVAPVRQ